ncbi:MAG: hypothetical protein ACYC7A_18685 [Thermoanaerobaculia bacterium]
MKRTALVLSLLSVFAFACASNMSDATAPLGGSAAATGRFSPTHYRLVSDPDMIIAIKLKDIPRAYHVKGQSVNGGQIAWAPTLDGHGKLCVDGKEWISLNDGEIHVATETPVAPYILGCRASNGLFQPASTQVVLQ